MEKKKKNGEEIKEEKKRNISIQKKDLNNKVVFSENLKKNTRLAIFISTIIVSATLFITFVFGFIVSLNAADLSKQELLNDNFSVTFISKLHGLSIQETFDLVNSFGSKALFIIFEIILPVLIIIIVMILVLILFKHIIDFMSEIKYEKELYVEDNIPKVESMISYIAVILGLTLFGFNNPSLLVYGLICLLLFIVLVLFKKCVKKGK